MAKSIIEFKHTFSLSNQWRQAFVDHLGGKILEDHRIMTFDGRIAQGDTYFTELSPGIFVLLIDATINTPIRFTRTASEDDFWVIYYDLSDNLNNRTINKIEYPIGESSKFGLGIIDSKLNSSYNTEVGNRIYSLRIFIDKKVMNNFIDLTVLKEEFKDIFDIKKKKIFFYRFIDSRSKVVLYNLKKQNIRDFYFYFEIKSTAYNLLGYFLERIGVDSTGQLTYEKDIEAVTKTQVFLLDNLNLPFPGVDVLATMANMSPSKYNKIYKKMFGNSANTYFRDQKLNLAYELLTSGRFKYVSDVVFELSYSKTTYFTMVFKNAYGFLPSTIFIKLEE